MGAVFSFIPAVVALGLLAFGLERRAALALAVFAVTRRPLRA
ncbi:MAG TPA: hypothetical protein VES79_10200 [Solirubrobacteraceae bacterium]|nr:hypothetical protein [Solirubrobacteraceae bacterium]